MRFENFIASHLLKATHLWNDLGIGVYGLYFLRNKDKQEVDFVVTRNNKPWILVEAKSSANQGMSKSLVLFHNTTGTPYAFQVSNTDEYENISCFKKEGMWMVSAKTFLSQLF
jgi:predicted AAA+ superfamily ATPase